MFAGSVNGLSPFNYQSDSETEVPVNTPAGSTRTRAGRLSIPNSRYLNWLA